MKKSFKQIRDLELIEKELNDCHVGVFAFLGEDDKLIQISTTFLYKDKNIYTFFSVDSELFEEMQFENSVMFTIVKELKIRKSKKVTAGPKYRYLSITISGIAKKVEDSKVVEGLKINYAKKYSLKKNLDEIDYSIVERAVIIDTEEIKAIEESGE